VTEPSIGVRAIRQRLKTECGHILVHTIVGAACVALARDGGAAQFCLSLTSDSGDQPPRFGRTARILMRAGQTAVLAWERRRGGSPQRATCAEVQRSTRRLREVARAIHDELVGMEDSFRRVGCERELTAVAERFPRGARDIEALVLEACSAAAPGDRPYRIVMDGPLRRELGLVGYRPL
jgi:hypothetical protein